MIQNASELGQFLTDLIIKYKDSLSIADIFYGDQNMLPRTPSACVIVGDASTELVGAPRYVQTDFSVQVLVYHCKIQDSQITELECTQRAEGIRDLLNNAYTLGGRVLNGMVTKVEPGFIEKGASQSWYRTTRLTWEGYSRFNLPLEEVL